MIRSGGPRTSGGFCRFQGQCIGNVSAPVHRYRMRIGGIERHFAEVRYGMEDNRRAHGSQAARQVDGARRGHRHRDRQGPTTPDRAVPVAARRTTTPTPVRPLGTNPCVKCSVRRGVSSTRNVSSARCWTLSRRLGERAPYGAGVNGPMRSSPALRQLADERAGSSVMSFPGGRKGSRDSNNSMPEISDGPDERPEVCCAHLGVWARIDSL